MIVSELIEKLKTLPPTAPVHIRDMEWADTLPLGRVLYLKEGDGDVCDRTKTPLNVVIMDHN